MEKYALNITALILGFLLDAIIGDPKWLPHLIVGFGKSIAFLEKHLNKRRFKFFKGAAMSVLLVSATFFLTHFCLVYSEKEEPFVTFILTVLVVFFSLSAMTLRREVQQVFVKLNISVENGQTQLSRIVGRDTNQLSASKIRSAALETLSENLSDGVIAPLFWFSLLGAPGMLAYKMINTLDSMIGYKNERYLLFGKFPARLDDVANYIPARLTAAIMLLVSGNLLKFRFVLQYGKKHTSPNSGYPESALAAILQCRFGGTNFYSGKRVEKPFIGNNPRELTYEDLEKSIQINKRSEICMLITSCFSLIIIQYFNHL